MTDHPQGRPTEHRSDFLRALERAGQVLLAAVLVAFPALLGWVPGWAEGRATTDASLSEVLLVLPSLLLLPLAVAALGLRRERLPRSVAVVFGLCAVLLAWVLFQIVPLPPSIHGALSPGSQTVMTRAAPPDQALGAGPQPLSISPSDTTLAAIRLAAALSVMVAAFAFVRTRRDFLNVLVPVVASGAFLALLGVIKSVSHAAGGAPAAGEKAILFPCGSPGARASGPFFNANQFAGYLEILFPVAAGLLLWIRSKSEAGDSLKSRLASLGRYGPWFVLAALASVLMAGGVLVSQSRLGILGFLAGGGILAILTVRRLGVKARAAAAVAAVIAAFFLYLGLEPVLNRYSLLADREVDRFQAWQMSVDIAEDFPVAGTGLGTFRRISPAYQPDDLKGAYFQTHNDYLNMASDIGIVGLALVLSLYVTWVATVWPGLKREGRFRPALVAAALAASGAMLVHSTGDFNLQVGAIAVHMAALAGLGMAAARSADPAPPLPRGPSEPNNLSPAKEVA